MMMKLLDRKNKILAEEFKRQAIEIFGSQAVVVNIEAKEWDNWYECYTDCGRVQSNKVCLRKR